MGPVAAMPVRKGSGMKVETSSAKRKTARVYSQNEATIRAILLVGAVFMLVTPIVQVVTALFIESRAVPNYTVAYLLVGGLRAAAGAVVRAALFVLIFWSAKDFFFERWVLYGTGWWFVSILGVSWMAITGSSGLAASALHAALSLVVFMFSAYLVKEIFSRTTEIRTVKEKFFGQNSSSKNEKMNVEEEPIVRHQKDPKMWNIFVLFLGLEIAVAFFFMTFIKWEYGVPAVYEVPSRKNLLIIGSLALFLIVLPVFNNIRSNVARCNDSDDYSFNRFTSILLLFSMALYTNSLWFLNNIFDGSQMTIGMVFGPLFLLGIVVVGVLGILNFFSLVISFPRKKISSSLESH